jgi:hypothetical protein
MKLGPVMLFTLVTVLGPVLIFMAAVSWHRRQRGLKEKPPQSEKLLRPPGYSLSIRLYNTADAILFDLLIAIALCAFFGGGSEVLAEGLNRHVQITWRFISVVTAAQLALGCGCIFFMLRAFRRFDEAQNIRLGLRGEQAVAEMLHDAMESGFHSFHDIPGDGDWNIDHVAVGKRGVFLIETKARRKRGSRNGQAAHEVIYDGQALQFPFYRDAKPIEQAKRNAKWLSNYLRKKTGEPVEVAAVVVLPGWYVTTSERGNFTVRVMNPKYLLGYLQRESEKLGDAQVRRIIATLDEKCRDMEF